MNGIEPCLRTAPLLQLLQSSLDHDFLASFPPNAKNGNPVIRSNSVDLLALFALFACLFVDLASALASFFSWAGVIGWWAPFVPRNASKGSSKGVFSFRSP